MGSTDRGGFFGGKGEIWGDASSLENWNRNLKPKTCTF